MISPCVQAHISISVLYLHHLESSPLPHLSDCRRYIYIYVNVAYKHTSRHISSRSILKRHCLETSGRFRLSKRAVIWDRPWPSATHTWARTHRLEPTDVYICTFVHLYTWSDVLSAVWHERTRGLRAFPSSPLEHRWKKKSSLDGERLAEPRLWASSSILEFAHVHCGDGDPKEAEPFDARHISALEIIDEEDDERGHVLRQETYKKQMPVM